jgi:hypothetical protein
MVSPDTGRSSNPQTARGGSNLATPFRSAGIALTVLTKRTNAHRSRLLEFSVQDEHWYVNFFKSSVKSVSKNALMQ